MRDCLTSIDLELSRSFLALRGAVPSPTASAPAQHYARLLGAFDQLCNLNRRDREIASRELAALEGTPLAQSFPAVLRGLRAWNVGSLDDARDELVAHLALHPDDYVGLFLLHMFDFLHGRPDLYSNYLAADARCEDPAFGGYFRGVLAFSLCEQGRPDEGLAHARAACDREDLDDIYSVHALVHCWHAEQEHARIVEFLNARMPQWIDNPGMNIHVTWHLAVSLMALGKVQESIDAYRRFRSLGAGNHAEQDLDAVNYCVRLFFRSVPRPEFFYEHQTLARNWAPSIYNFLSYFNDAHAAIAFMLADERALMAKLLNRPEISTLDRETRETGQTILRAINDFMNQDYAPCVERFERTRSSWPRIGGSFAQREIFDVLVDAATALGCGARPAGRVRFMPS